MGTWLEGFLTENPMLMDQVISALAVAFAGLWTRYKMSEHRERLRDKRYGKALDAIDAAVEDTGRKYVRMIKAAAKDGKLTLEEIGVAHSYALDRAKQFARGEGIDLVAELGRDYLNLQISRAAELQKLDIKRPLKSLVSR